MKSKLLLSLGVLGIFVQIGTSQNTVNKQSQLPREEINMPYQFIDRDAMPSSPAYEFYAPNYFTKQVNISANGNNIVGDAANEPSLAVDPTNPDRIVIGWRQFDTVESDFRQAGYGYSLNGGYDWRFPGVLTPGFFRSDPVLDFDNLGNFYYNSLQSDFACDVFAIKDGGVVWGSPVPAHGGDKQWMRIDRTGGPSAGHNYSYWNKSFSTCTGSFTRSTDTAESFEPCVDIPTNPFWGTLAVDADANLYLTGRINNETIVLLKSETAKDPSVPVTFSPAITVDLDGKLNFGAPINPQGLTGQAWVAIDVSGGPGRDNVYVLASVERNGTGDPADVMFAKSTDGGVTFSAPTRINSDTGTEAYQWFGTMAVAPNGRIDVVWLDTRDAPSGTFHSVLYYSFSEDQGESWSVNTPISEVFDPTIGYPVQQKMGDYFDMKSDDFFAHIAWCATFTGGEDVYYTKVSPDGTLAIPENEFLDLSFTIIPNPVMNTTTLRFNTLDNVATSVVVFDILGRKVTTLAHGVYLGPQEIDWNIMNTHGQKISSGMYFIRVRSGTYTETKKVIIR